MTTNGNEPTDIERALAQIPDDDALVVKNDVGAVAELNRSELETQLDAAHRYPRSTKRFLSRAMTLATMTVDIAEMCMYTLPRGGKPIVGPSVRLAEIIASTYGNLHVGARPVEVGRKEVISQGVAWDLENNFRVTLESKRRITNKDDKRFNEDMIQVTHAACTSIAFRNAVFRVVPRSYVDTIFAHVRRVAVGDAKTLDAKRQELFDRLGKMGVHPDRALAAVSKPSIEDVGLEEVEVLIGLGTAIKNNDMTIDQAFPPVAKQESAGEGQPVVEGQRTPLRRPKAQAAAAEPEKRPGVRVVVENGDGTQTPVDPATDPTA